LPIQVARLDPPPSGEVDARAGRYRALEAMRVRTRAGAVATGHTLDDDAETVLLRQARGGFPLGIPPCRGTIVRPLLAVRRAATSAYCAERGFPVLTDPSNADESLARNRIRRRLLPELGDAGIEALADLGRRSRRAVVARRAEVDGLLAELLRNPALLGEIRLDRAGLGSLGADLQRSVVRRVLGAVGIEPSGRLVEDLCTRLLARGGGPIDLPGGYVARSEPSDVVIARPEPHLQPPPIALAAPGGTALPAWGLEAVVEVFSPPPAVADLLGGTAPGGAAPGWRAVAPGGAAPGGTAGWRAVLDAGVVGTQDLALRSRLPGDRYRPLGAPGERKLQDLFVDAKIPRAERDRVPVLTCAGRIAWVAGFRIDDRYRLTPESPAALRVTLAPIPVALASIPVALPPTAPDPRP
ncbi:MAG TPA: tRNA lysidine(34) synthetase TilS, partial [Actinomycetota bacterium]|nr:tRNA lysidine(34) synthetase TilS [Actinomycetota bacterium]